MYLAFKPDDCTAQNNAMAATEECLHEIRQWMIRDRLLINCRGDLKKVLSDF